MAPMGMGMETYTNISLFLGTLKNCEKKSENCKDFQLWGKCLT